MEALEQARASELRRAIAEPTPAQTLGSVHCDLRRMLKRIDGITAAVPAKQRGVLFETLNCLCMAESLIAAALSDCSAGSFRRLLWNGAKGPEAAQTLPE